MLTLFYELLKRVAPAALDAALYCFGVDHFLSKAQQAAYKYNWPESRMTREMRRYNVQQLHLHWDQDDDIWWMEHNAWKREFEWWIHHRDDDRKPTQ